MIDTTILGVVVLIAFGIFFILFVVTVVSTANSREKRRRTICDSNCTYPTACAGSPVVDIPASASELSLEYVEFKDKDGNVVNPDNFWHFIVKGESMQFADIHDNYMIFVDKEKRDIDFPKVIVLRREAAPKDQVQYKIRRGWQFSNVKDAENVVKNILASKEFDIIRKLQPYDDDKSMLEDFVNKRLARYIKEHPFSNSEGDRYFDVIISTTYHTEKCPNEEERGKIRFSIHPASLLVGEVVKSFPM
ncbi:MAG: hypothetical protein IKC18_06960 [Bacteroidaceae bacterium]|nr:hypothetical protein [Bacteroidaceae bacterium]